MGAKIKDQSGDKMENIMGDKFGLQKDANK